MFFRDWSFNDLLAGIFKAFIDLDPKNGLPGLCILVHFRIFVRPCSARVPLEVPSLVLATVWAPFGLFWIQFWLRFGIAGTRAGIEYTRGKARHWIWTFPAVEAYFSASTLYFPLLLHHCFAHWFYSIFDICELTFDICYDVFLLFSWSHLHLATPSKTMTLTLLLACSGTSGKHDLPCSYCSVYIYIYIYTIWSGLLTIELLILSWRQISVYVDRGW